MDINNKILKLISKVNPEDREEWEALYNRATSEEEKYRILFLLREERLKMFLDR